MTEPESIAEFLDRTTGGLALSDIDGERLHAIAERYYKMSCSIMPIVIAQTKALKPFAEFGRNYAEANPDPNHVVTMKWYLKPFLVARDVYFAAVGEDK